MFAPPRGPTVHLDALVGTALIVAWPTGIHYVNQTMGHFCAQPSIEGALVPIANDVELPSERLLGIERELIALFADAHGAANGLSDALAGSIEQLLGRTGEMRGVRVDRARLRESHEAWVYVTIEPDKNETLALFHGFGHGTLGGVLTWSNSD